MRDVGYNQSYAITINQLSVLLRKKDIGGRETI